MSFRSFHDRIAEALQRPNRVPLGASRRPKLPAPGQQPRAPKPPLQRTPRLAPAPSTQPQKPAQQPGQPPKPKKTFGQRVAGGVLALSQPDVHEKANEVARRAGRAITQKAGAAKAGVQGAFQRVGQAVRGAGGAAKRTALAATNPETVNRAATKKLKQWAG